MPSFSSSACGSKYATQIVVALPSLTVQCSEILIHRVAPRDAEVYERHHAVAFRNETVVTEPPEVENIGEIGQHLVAEESRPHVHTAQGR